MDDRAPRRHVSTTPAAAVAARLLRTDVDVLCELVDIAGRRVVDVGCGDGSLVRWLVAQGARALGIEVSPRALSRARAADPGRSGEYRVGRAQALPLPDASVDVAVFWRSLHHVAPDAMATALAEARRVLCPGGLVYVAEPLATGSYFELLRRIDDETTVRELAQRRVAAAPTVGLARRRTLEYDVLVQVAGLGELRKRVVAADPQRAARFDALASDLRRSAETLTERDGRGWTFRQPMRVNLLRRVDCSV